MHGNILPSMITLILLLKAQGKSEELTEKILKPLRKEFQMLSMIEFCENNPTKTDTELIDQAKIFASMKEIP